MGIARHIGISIGIAVVAATVTVTPAAAAEDPPPPDRTALILCGTTCPTPNAFWIEAIKNKYIAPTHPGQNIDAVGVTAPMVFWPITGIFRLLGLAVGPPEIWGPGGPGWPDEPWWKLSGLFDMTANESLRVGVADLEAAIAAQDNDHLVIYGNSQGAGIANVVKKHLATQYPDGTTPPDIDFVLGGDPNLPNGGLMSRFAGLYIPFVNLTFNGSAATDTQFKTVEINRQYDGFSDFPLYPLNLIADLNAVLGIVYVHMYGLDVSLPENPMTSPAYQGTHGDTSYYFFENQDLPLFGPLRTLGVPERLIDVVEPFFRVIVEVGYDRTIKPWEPTPARLIPAINPGKLAADLAAAFDEGVDNARHLISPPPTSAKLRPATSDSHAVGKPSTRAVKAASRPTRDAPRSQAISPSRGNDHGGRGISARRH
ncbi:PE-PPE domain-containing protein [Mycobacterium sp. RTGN5]|uniref:PE-PPE domain-containing protein n=1 Tax=Mycobacterium sp. RTGN5 TaxID=3016522 RepID=UPI0029C7F5E4|nr:PE-PPE domain-containing protein [Mycobacterium sp. RTGN5]